MSAEPNHVLWLDLETTGVRPDDEILEVACVLTDMKLNEISRFEMVARPYKPHWIEELDQFVLEMHVKNDLIRDVRDAELRIEQVERALLEWLDGVGKEEQYALAGSGVAHFDRQKIKQYMPHLDVALTYWSLDVGVLRRFLTRLGGFEFPRAPIAHRAMADVEQSIEEAKRILGSLSYLAPGVHKDLEENY